MDSSETMPMSLSFAGSGFSSAPFVGRKSEVWKFA